MYKILIVEDDLDMQRLLVDYLKKSGMEAVATDSPKEALEMVCPRSRISLASWRFSMWILIPPS